MRIPRSFAFLGAIALVAAACGGSTAQTSPTPGAATSAPAAAKSSAPAAAKFPTKAMTLIAPAGAGGGYDTTARLIQKIITDAKIVDQTVTVMNQPGNGGLTATADLLTNYKSDAHRAMVIGRVGLGAQITTKSQVKISQLTPIARLMGEAELVTAPANSPFNTVNDVIAALKKDPNSVKFAGGSAGGIDQELAAMLVQLAGGDVKSWKGYVAYSGGGEAAAAVIGGQVQVGISGGAEWYPHIQSGKMKALGISASAAPKSETGSKIKTLKDQGIDIVLLNWRILTAPPDLKPDELKALQDIMKKVHDTPAWKDFVKKNDWEDNFTTEGLPPFIQSEEQKLTKVLTDLGLVK